MYKKKIALENEVETAVVTVDLEGDKEVSSVIPQKEDPRISEDDVTSSDINISHSESQLAESECTSIESASPNITSDSSSSCTDICCISDTVPFQPSSSAILQGMCRNGRNFVPTWFKQYPWLTLCRTREVLTVYIADQILSMVCWDLVKMLVLLLLRMVIPTGKKLDKSSVVMNPVLFIKKQS